MLSTRVVESCISSCKCSRKGLAFRSDCMFGSIPSKRSNSSGRMDSRRRLDMLLTNTIAWSKASSCGQFLVPRNKPEALSCTKKTGCWEPFRHSRQSPSFYPVIAQIFYPLVEFTEVVHVVLVYCFVLQNKYKRVAFPLHECYINIAL